MANRHPPPITAAKRRQFQRRRDATTLQLLFKAARLANERALAYVAADPSGPGARIRPAHTALFPHLDFDGVRQTDLAARVGVTKQAVGQLIDDLVQLGMVERIADPDDRRAKRIRFSRRGHGALMHGLAILQNIEVGLNVAVGAKRMGALRDTLKLVAAALEASPAVTRSSARISARSTEPR